MVINSKVLNGTTCPDVAGGRRKIDKVRDEFLDQKQVGNTGLQCARADRGMCI